MVGLFAERRASAQEKQSPTLGTIERLDPRLDQIVPKDARVERIAEGFDWSEGPVWDRRGGYLLLIDTLARTMAQVEIPLGILTAVIGTPFFIWLLASVQKNWS